MARLIFPVSLRYFHSIEVDAAAIWERTKEVFSKNWHLGITAFGGPPVHFQIVCQTELACRRSLTLPSFTGNLLKRMNGLMNNW
jgi:hypothetical protein